jgi:hypothetical protein
MGEREDLIAQIKAKRDSERTALIDQIKAKREASQSWLDTDLGPTLPFMGHVPFRPRQTIQSFANALPGAGALMAGGAAAIPTGGAGALPAAGFGGATGEALKNLIEQNVLGKQKTAEQLALGPAQGAVDGLTQEMGGQSLNAVLAPTGKYLYKAGLKNLDLIGARYGKDPVSDVLMQNRVKGSAAAIQQQMDELGDTLLGRKNQLLHEATANGGEVDMNRAVKEAQDLVDRYKYIDNHEMRDATNVLQKRIDGFRSRNAQSPQDVLRELPFTREATSFEPQPENIHDWYEAPTNGTVQTSTPKTRLDAKGKQIINFDPARPGTGEITVKKLPDQPLINNAVDSVQTNSLPVAGEYTPKSIGDLTTIFDQSERVPGPSPIQVDAWKTTSANAAGDDAWKAIANTTEGRGFDKQLANGQRAAVEDAVGQYHPLGSQAKKSLIETNADLGKILTSSERAQLDAEIEARKNAVTPIDALAIAHGGPVMAGLKKIADLSKESWFRTNAGLGLQDLSTTGLPGYFARPMTTQKPNNNLEDVAAPWLQMQRKDYGY